MSRLISLSLVCFFLLFSCVSSSKDIVMTTLPKPEISGTDYRKQGQYNFSSHRDSMKSSFGCRVDYTLYQPDKLQHDTLIILGHGFFRSQKTLRHLAGHYASWGLQVATLDFCNSRPWNGHHPRNGADMVALADKLEASKVIYAGFSAGGLAAFLAASEDPRTQAYLGFDMVDNFSKAKKSANKIKVPVYGLVAESSGCNAKNNALDAYKLVENNHILKLHGASHCDFEFPYDKKCRFVCGKSREPYEREDIQQSILGLSTSMLLQAVQQETTENKSWWHELNENFMELVKTKRVSVMEF